ncbi:MAG: NFACT family protein, partial [Chloroflexi bacterium]|nr:NFACT family protein [Chloroflexota bacterium]
VDPGGTVVDALRRVPASVNRARVTLPRQAYEPPPPQAKLSPSTLVTSDVTRVLADRAGGLLWPSLVKSIAGVSPLFAREVAFRVTGRADGAAEPGQADAVLTHLARLMRAPWEPTVAFEGGQAAAFAPYRLEHFGEVRAADSISAAIEAFYGAPDPYGAAKESLRPALEEARDRLARKRDALAKSLPAESEIERLRVHGELILAYASGIATGQELLQAETEAGMVDIELDPRLSPVQNAQEYFKQYRRAKDSAARVPALLAAANAEVEYAEQMLNDLEIAEDRGEVDAVVRAARDAGLQSALVAKQPRPTSARSPSAPREFVSRDGFRILVGKNAKQNEEITFHRARPDDLWLHARNVAGAHVVVVRAGREVPETTVREAAALAARYSQAHGDAHVEAIVTPRRNVHRARGGKPGMVTVRTSETVEVDGERSCG